MEGRVVALHSGPRRLQRYPADLRVPTSGAATRLHVTLLIAALGCRLDGPDTDGTDTARPPIVEAGDTLDEAQALEDAEAMRIDPAGDRDFYWFVAEPGVTYDVSVGTGPDVGAFDPVLRTYDEAGRLLAESDVLPYALRGHNPGLLVRGDGGRVYVEVLDHGDWVGQSPFGGASARYDVAALRLDRLEPNEDTNADNDTVEQSDANAVAGNYDWFLDPWMSVLHFVVGDAAAPGDVDHLSIDFRSSQLPAVWQVSAVPGVISPYGMRLSLIDPAGREVASTQDPLWREPPLTLDDAGISFPVLAPGRYFVRVEDTNGGSGDADWYALLGSLVPLDDALRHDFPAAETANEAVVLELIADATGDRPSHFRAVYGEMEDFAGVPDPFDTFIVEPASGAVRGATVSVRIETAAAGSALDARLVLALDDGTVLATSDEDPGGQYVDEPAVFDVVLPADGPIRITVEPQNGASGAAAFYLGTVRVVSPG